MELKKAVFFGTILLVALFCLDLMINISALAILYICFILFALWTDNEKFIFGTLVISTILIMIAWIFHGGGTGYDNVARLLAGVVIWVTGLLSIQRKQVENRLKMLNETLELRVMARTAASEEKSRRLELQIKALQGIRHAGTKNSLSQLDEIIHNLQEISKLEAFDE